MPANDSKANALHNAPVPRAEFLSIRLKRDPDQALAEVCRLLCEGKGPGEALAECSEWIDGHGVESMLLATGEELHYVKKGDTYDATLCHVEGRSYFVASWGDVHEAADRQREEQEGERRCAYCSEWAEQGSPCGACGRDPESGDMWPDPLRYVRLETGHTLRTWDTGKYAGSGMMGRTCIGYELCTLDGEIVFRETDFGPSPLHADDADETLRALLGFLTLRKGDTDRDYFEGYSQGQLAFRDSDACEQLAFLYSDGGPGTFEDIDDESPACGHSACRQYWIDTGKGTCVDGDVGGDS